MVDNIAQTLNLQSADVNPTAWRTAGLHVGTTLLFVANLGYEPPGTICLDLQSGRLAPRRTFHTPVLFRATARLTIWFATLTVLVAETKDRTDQRIGARQPNTA